MNQETLYYTTLGSPIGELLLVSDGEALVGLYLEGDCRRPEPSALWRRDDDVFHAASDQFAAYFAGKLTAFTLRLAPRGTAFQLRVWELLRPIPFGTTVSYGELARRLGQPGASRAIGAANACNPISIIVPCHRIIGSDGALTGYAAGIERKKWLLDHETQGSGITNYKLRMTNYKRRSHAAFSLS
jgi:methylated-DNA-[protein]-cysteine S-methyltransferase